MQLFVLPKYRHQDQLLFFHELNSLLIENAFVFSMPFNAFLHRWKEALEWNWIVSARFNLSPSLTCNSSVALQYIQIY